MFLERSVLVGIDVISRAIMRIILGSRPSTPRETLYTDLATAPVQDRRWWVSRKYLINLSLQPFVSTYTSVKLLFANPSSWPKFKIPVSPRQSTTSHNKTCLSFTVEGGLPFHPSASPRQVKSSVVKRCGSRWAKVSQSKTPRWLSYGLTLWCNASHVHPYCAYSDGSVSDDRRSTSCAIYIPAWGIEKSWSLSRSSSIFSAELFGVLKVLQCVIDYPIHPFEVFIFIDSSAAIKAIVSPGLSLNEIVFDIRQLLVTLTTRESCVNLVWIPSHVGIAGNEAVDRLARQESETPSGNVIVNQLSA